MIKLHSSIYRVKFIISIIELYLTHAIKLLDNSILDQNSDNNNNILLLKSRSFVTLELECCICYISSKELLPKGQKTVSNRLMSFECSHIICLECAHTMITNNTCPYCRAEIKLNFDPIFKQREEVHFDSRQKPPLFKTTLDKFAAFFALVSQEKYFDILNYMLNEEAFHVLQYYSKVAHNVEETFLDLTLFYDPSTKTVYTRQYPFSELPYLFLFNYHDTSKEALIFFCNVVLAIFKTNYPSEEKLLYKLHNFIVEVSNLDKNILTLFKQKEKSNNSDSWKVYKKKLKTNLKHRHVSVNTEMLECNELAVYRLNIDDDDDYSEEARLWIYDFTSKQYLRKRRYTTRSFYQEDLEGILNHRWQNCYPELNEAKYHYLFLVAIDYLYYTASNSKDYTFELLENVKCHRKLNVKVLARRLTKNNPPSIFLKNSYKPLPFKFKMEVFTNFIVRAAIHTILNRTSTITFYKSRSDLQSTEEIFKDTSILSYYFVLIAS